MRVGDCAEADALGLGVHPAIGAGLTRYVRRDAHEGLGAEFAAGGLVLVEGPSAAGKSRLAYEVTRSQLPDRSLIVPDGPVDLRELAGAHDAVVWLDDVDRYLTTGGLNPDVLDRLCPPGRRDVLVLGTLSLRARAAIAAFTLASTFRLGIDQVLDRARTVPVDRILSVAEREVAERHRDDPRIAAALDQQAADVGFAEYLSAAPAILRRWRTAEREGHPGAAVVSAAVNARCAGHRSSLPSGLLEELLDIDERGFDAALAWAVEPVDGASGCLNAVGDGGFEPFDYLVEHREVDAVPPPMWDPLVSLAAGQDLLAIGMAAYTAQRGMTSEAAFERAADGGDVAAMHNLGVRLRETGRPEEATVWYRRAAEEGDALAMYNLGVLLTEIGRAEEAETWMTRAGTLIDVAALDALGFVLFETPWARPETAARLRGAAEGGDVVAMRHLAPRVGSVGRFEEMEHWQRSAAERGDVTAMKALGDLLSGFLRNEEAEQWWRRAAEAGDTAAMHSLSALLMDTGHAEEGDAWLRRAAEAGDVLAMLSLGRMLKEMGRTEEAGQWWRRAAEAGQLGAMRELADLLNETGHTEEAGVWLQRATAPYRTAD
jgi:uncharacterized protein